MEMIHTASLVHDDVIDEAATRRGVCRRTSTGLAPAQLARRCYLADVRLQRCNAKAICPPCHGALTVVSKRNMRLTVKLFDLVKWPIKQRSLCAGRPTVNKKFSTKTAVLVGDFLFAQSSYLLAHLDNSEVGDAMDRFAAVPCDIRSTMGLLSFKSQTILIAMCGRLTDSTGALPL